MNANTIRKNEWKKRKRFRNYFSNLNESYLRKILNEKVKNITVEIFRIIPNICFRQKKITTGLDRNHLEIFLKVKIKLETLYNILSKIKCNSDRFFSFAFFEFFKNIVEKLICWLSITDDNVIIVIINSIPIAIKIADRVKKNNTKKSRKRFRSMNSSELLYTEKLTKRFVQILSLFSTSIHVGTRVSCIFNMNVLTKTDGFNIEILDEALLPQESPFENAHVSERDNYNAFGDTTIKPFDNFTIKFRGFEKNVIFSSKISLIKFFKINSIRGIKSDIYDKGWIYRRLEDESPAVRFEIFMMINDLIKLRLLSISESLMERINDIVFDYFLDENIAVQTLISEIIVIISRKKVPIKTENISKIIPTLNDYNTNTKYNLLKIAAFGIFSESKGLIKLITTLTNSSIEQLDATLFYNIIPSVIMNNLKISIDIINDLFVKYFEKEGFYHRILLIFTYWAIWNSPSIINEIDPKLVLLYPVAKLDLHGFVPKIKFKFLSDSNLELPFTEHITCRKDSKKLEIYIKKPTGRYNRFFKYENRFDNKHKGRFINSKNQKRLMDKILFDSISLENIVSYLNRNLTSRHYFIKNKQNLLSLLKVFEFFTEPAYNCSFRTYINSRINIVLRMLSINVNVNSFSHLLRGINVNELLKFGRYGLIYDCDLFPLNYYFKCELSTIHKYKVVSSNFSICMPLTTDSTPYLSIFENKKKITRHKNNKRCLSTLSNDGLFKNNLFCRCMFCKMYFSNSVIKHSNISSATSNNNKTVDHFKTLVFPFKIVQKIPINISFNFGDLETRLMQSLKLNNSTINLCIQIPRILRFSHINDKLMDSCTKKYFNINSYSDSLDELNSLNFATRKPIEIHSDSGNRGSIFNVMDNIKNEAVEIMSIKLKCNDRSARILPINNEIQNITLSRSIPVIYEYPLASKVSVLASIKNYKFGFMDSISNTYFVNVLPDDLKLI